MNMFVEYLAIVTLHMITLYTFIINIIIIDDNIYMYIHMYVCIWYWH